MLRAVAMELELPAARIKHAAGHRARTIAALAGEGLTSREIAARIGLSHSRICRIASRSGIRLSRPGARQFALYIPN